MVSKKFKIAVKLADVPAWKIAYKAGVHPNVLSKIMSGAINVKLGDHRVKSVAKVIGLVEDDCFEPNGKGGADYGN